MFTNNTLSRYRVHFNDILVLILHSRVPSSDDLETSFLVSNRQAAAISYLFGEDFLLDPVDGQDGKEAFKLNHHSVSAAAVRGILATLL